MPPMFSTTTQLQGDGLLTVKLPEQGESRSFYEIPTSGVFQMVTPNGLSGLRVKCSGNSSLVLTRIGKHGGEMPDPLNTISIPDHFECVYYGCLSFEGWLGAFQPREYVLDEQLEQQEVKTKTSPQLPFYDAEVEDADTECVHDEEKWQEYLDGLPSDEARKEAIAHRLKVQRERQQEAEQAQQEEQAASIAAEADGSTGQTVVDEVIQMEDKVDETVETLSDAEFKEYLEKRYGTDDAEPPVSDEAFGEDIEPTVPSEGEPAEDPQDGLQPTEEIQLAVEGEDGQPIEVDITDPMMDTAELESITHPETSENPPASEGEEETPSPEDSVVEVGEGQAATSSEEEDGGENTAAESGPDQNVVAETPVKEKKSKRGRKNKKNKRNKK